MLGCICFLLNFIRFLSSSLFLQALNAFLHGDCSLSSSSLANLLRMCLVFQVVNTELRVLSQVLIPESSSHTADHCTLSLMAQTVFQPPYFPVTQSTTCRCSYKGTMGDSVRMVKIYNIHQLPLVHRASHHTFTTDTTGILALCKS